MARDNHLTTESGGRGQGQHRHALGGLTAGSGLLTTADTAAHQHNLPVIGLTPSYVAVKFIIRIF